MNRHSVAIAALKAAIIMSEPAEHLHELHRVADELLEVVLLASEDKMKLFLEAQPLDEQRRSEISETHMLSLLAGKCDTGRFNERVVQDIVRLLREGSPAPRRRVAKGEPPVAGRDGRFVLLVKPHTGFGKRESKDFVDARFFRHFDNIEPQTPVMRIYPPDEGRDGENALGEKVPAQAGSPASVKLDQSLQRLPAKPNAGFETVVALSSGYLAQEGDAWKIFHELKIDGDLDLHIGDLDFVGDVLVTGSVGKDFTIRARGDITVRGNVYAATLISEQGSIRVEGDVAGGKDASVLASAGASSAVLDRAARSGIPAIRAAKHFYGKTVHQALIFSRYSVHIAKELRDSIIRTGGSLDLAQGHLFGGESYAVCGVEAKFIGTDGGARTVVHLCSTVESSQEYGELTAEINAHEQAAQLLRLHLGPYAGGRAGDDAPLVGSHALKIEAMKKKLAAVEKSYKALLQRRTELKTNATFNSTMRVNFNKKMYLGAEVTAGPKTFVAPETLQGPQSLEFDAKTQEFSLHEYTALECDFEETEETKQ